MSRPHRGSSTVARRVPGVAPRASVFAALDGDDTANSEIELFTKG